MAYKGGRRTAKTNCSQLIFPTSEEWDRVVRARNKGWDEQEEAEADERQKYINQTDDSSDFPF